MTTPIIRPKINRKRLLITECKSDKLKIALLERQLWSKENTQYYGFKDGSKLEKWVITLVKAMAIDIKGEREAS